LILHDVNPVIYTGPIETIPLLLHCLVTSA